MVFYPGSLVFLQTSDSDLGRCGIAFKFQNGIKLSEIAWVPPVAPHSEESANQSHSLRTQIIFCYINFQKIGGRFSLVIAVKYDEFQCS